MSTGDLLILLGIIGLTVTLIAVPVTAVVLHRQGRAIAQSIHEEYEL